MESVDRIAGVKSVFKLRSSASHTLLRCGACPHQTLSWSGAGASSVTASWGGAWGHTYPWSLTTPESMTPKHFPPVQSFPAELVSSTSDLANISSSGSLRRRQWHPTPVLLPGKSHGLRSLVGCSSWGPEESDMTERLRFHFSLSCVGEGNGNPLQCSCLENPRDGGAWWAAIYGVAQSQTRLKRLSSSSSRLS